MMILLSKGLTTFSGFRTEVTHLDVWRYVVRVWSRAPETLFVGFLCLSSVIPVDPAISCVNIYASEKKKEQRYRKYITRVYLGWMVTTIKLSRRYLAFRSCKLFVVYFKKIFSSSDYIASNERVILNELERIWKELIVA
jgi:hypothetical protein